MFFGRLDDARALYLQYRGEKNVQGALQDIEWAGLSQRVSQR
jgi:hypothetical protein